MRKIVLQVYALRCDQQGSPQHEWQKMVFDFLLCENVPCVHSGFEKALGRLPLQEELFSGTAQDMISRLAALPETVENVFAAVTDKMMKELAAIAVESPLHDIPLRADPYHYAHLQWGNHRCPGKWFLQRWNAQVLP